MGEPLEHEQTFPEQRKEGETGPESHTPVTPDTPETRETPDTADMTAAAPAPRRRPGRTTLLIAGAAALGVLAGAVTGYAVQYHRDPTPLPPLAQQKLVTPKALVPDDATTNKTINANRWHKTDDDISKLLIEAPGGAKIIEEPGYDTLDSFATHFERPGPALSDLASDSFRRVATEMWEEDDRVTEVRLVQFNDFAGANEFQRDQSGYMSEKKFAGNGGAAIPGVPADLGHVWVFSELREKPGYYPLRQSRAIVRRGDIVVEVFYNDKRGRNISQSDVIDLAKRQLERL